MANVLDNPPSGNLVNNIGNAVGQQLTGIVSTKPVAKYLSGARCVLRINGKIIGFATSISWRINTTVNEIRTIDDYLPYELAPSIIEVKGSIGGFRIPGSGPTVEQIQSHMLSFLHQRYIEIEVKDSQSDNIIFKTKRALITGRSESINTNSLANISLDFTSIGYIDEVVPQEPANIGNNGVDPNGGKTPLGRLVDNITNVAGQIGGLF